MVNGLIILDGFGKAIDKEISAMDNANMPYYNSLLEKYSNTLIGASGEDVGLPKGQMGNSEVGHLNIGSGRIVYQELSRITKAISTGEFFKNPVLIDGINTNKTIHIMGLLSDGGVHSHIDHILALIDMASEKSNVVVHAFLDGRDVPPKSAKIYVQTLLDHIKKYKNVSLGTVIGRYFAMDRDNRWDRVKIAYDAMVNGIGEKSQDVIQTIEDRYNIGQTDEFILPIIYSQQSVKNGDSIIFANFRPDRARQITSAFIEQDFVGFKREKIDVKFVSMTEYDKEFKNINVAYMGEKLENTFGEYISNLGLKQLRIAETEKYAHVTFFFNGGVETPYKNEDRILINSPKVATYDMQPEMSANIVSEELIKVMKNYDVFILNFANADMVGHTGNFEAAKKACEALDRNLKIVVEKVIDLGGQCIITADHGNADIMKDKDGKPFTAHTINKVPFIVVSEQKYNLKNGGKLCDIAPTLLDLMKLDSPKEMTGESLL